MISQDAGTVTLLVPHDRYDIISKLHSLGHVQEQEHRDDGVQVTGRFPPAQSGLLKPFLVEKPKRKTRVRV